MCYFDTWTFEECPCKQWGLYSGPCAQSRQGTTQCEERFESLRQEYMPGKCERCQEFDAIDRELARAEQKVVQALTMRGKSPLEEVNSMVSNVYDELLNMRRERRNSRYNQATPAVQQTDNWYFPGTGISNSISTSKRERISSCSPKLQKFRISSPQTPAASDNHSRAHSENMTSIDTPTTQGSSMERLLEKLPKPSRKFHVRELYASTCNECDNLKIPCVKLNFSSSCEKCFESHIECVRFSNKLIEERTELPSERRVWQYGERSDDQQTPGSNIPENSFPSESPDRFESSSTNDIRLKDSPCELKMGSPSAHFVDPNGFRIAQTVKASNGVLSDTFQRDHSTMILSEDSHRLGKENHKPDIKAETVRAASVMMNHKTNLKNLKIFKTHTRGFRNGLRMSGDISTSERRHKSSIRDKELSDQLPREREACLRCMVMGKELSQTILDPAWFNMDIDKEAETTKRMTTTEHRKANTHAAPCIHESRARLLDVNQRFADAAKKAYEKLKTAAYSSRVSINFRRFYRDLGGLDDIIEMGFNALEKFFEGSIPRSLKEMYSFLHVSYAMSQADLDGSNKLGDDTFSRGISLFKYCLPSQPKDNEETSEQDLFDEIVGIMWKELNSGLAWIRKQNITSSLRNENAVLDSNSRLRDILEWSHDQGEATNLTNKDRPSDERHNELVSEFPRRSNYQPRSVFVPSWEALVTGTIFSHVVRFLRCLDEIGIVFFYLCGTYCSTIGSVAMSVLHSNSRHDRGRRADELHTAKQIEIQDHMLEKIIIPLKHEQAPGVRKISRTAKYMLTAGPLVDIPDVEKYVIGLVKIHKRPKEEFLRLISLILSLCQKCFHSAPRRLKHQEQTAYSDDYVKQRFTEEEMWYNVNEGVEEFSTPLDMESSFTQDSLDLVSDLPLEIHTTGSPVGLEFGLSTLGLDTKANEKEQTWTDDLFPWDSTLEFGTDISFAQDITRLDQSPLQPSLLTSPTISASDSVSTFPSICLSSHKRSAPQSPALLLPSPTIGSEAQGESQQPMKKRKLAPENKPWACEFPDCSHRDTTEANLRRHQNSEHGDDSIKSQVCICDFPGCNSKRTGARAAENIKTHKKRIHGVQSKRKKGF